MGKTRGGEIVLSFNGGNERVVVSIVQNCVNAICLNEWKQGMEVQDIYSGNVIFMLGRLFLQNYCEKDSASKATVSSF